MNLSDAADEARDFVARIEEANAEGVTQAGKYATAERDYRKLRSVKWAESAGVKKLAKEREDWVDAETAELRYERDLADALRRSAIERERSLRGALSALQTMVNAYRGEVELGGKGPR